MLKSQIYRLAEDPNSEQSACRVEGQGRNNLLVVVKATDYTDENSKMLTQMLMAIKHNLEESTLIVLSKDEDISIVQMCSERAISKILCFGIDPKRLGFNLLAGAYRILQLESQKIVCSHSLTDLSKDKQKKIALWQCIQEL